MIYTATSIGVDQRYEDERGTMFDAITASEWSQLNDIVKTIYSSSLDTLMPLVSDQAKSLIGCSHSMHHCSVMINGSLEAFGYGSNDLPSEAIERYQNEYETIDYINWFADEPTSRVYRDTDLVPKDFRENSEFMIKWMQPYGLFYCIGMTIAANSKPYGNVFLFRSKDEGDFTPKDIELLTVLNEHLCIRFERELPNGHSAKSISGASDPIASKYRLTQKESDVLACIAEGRQRSSIASHLFISENTLKKHLANIYKKTGISRYEDLIQLTHR